ncbi:MAG: serine protease, partial [Christensenellaceae bacterium]
MKVTSKMLVCKHCGTVDYMEALEGDCKCLACALMQQVQEALSFGTNQTVRMYEQLKYSTVMIDAGQEAGAGVLVKLRGKLYVLTAYHVVRPGIQSGDVRIRFDPEFFGDQAYPVEVEAIRTADDLALCRLEGKGRYPQGVVAREVCRGNLRQGEEVYACGNPNGIDFTCTKGNVSQEAYRSESLPREAKPLVICQLPTNGGNSGGPVVNARGEL